MYKKISRQFSDICSKVDYCNCSTIVTRQIFPTIKHFKQCLYIFLTTAFFSKFVFPPCFYLNIQWFLHQSAITCKVKTCRTYSYLTSQFFASELYRLDGVTLVTHTSPLLVQDRASLPTVLSVPEDLPLPPLGAIATRLATGVPGPPLLH